jgi:hypothetical protein
MSKPIVDKAEVSIDFPDKFYMGAFGRDSIVDVAADAEGLHLRLEHDGEQSRKVGFHVHYYLLAEILDEAASALAALPPIDEPHRVAVQSAAKKLASAVRKR